MPENNLKNKLVWELFGELESEVSFQSKDMEEKEEIKKAMDNLYYMLMKHLPCE